MRSATVALCVLLAANLAACLPLGSVGTLSPTLAMVDEGGVAIPMQNGMPVPTFSWQPRPRLDLGGEWSVEGVEMDPELTMAARDGTVEQLEEEGNGRHAVEFDDSGWERVEVPGTLNEPPDGEEGGAWFRRTVNVPRSWRGQAVTIRIGSANYVADVWLNGTWLGYHEGGHTPFALATGEALEPGERNVLAIRVHTIPLGTRADVLPWAAIDWWNYGGLTGPVWLEATPPAYIARADVIPHLDAVDVNVLVAQSDRPAGPPPDGDSSAAGSSARLRLSIFPATVDDANLFDPDPRRLVADLDDPLAVVTSDSAVPEPGGVHPQTISVLFGNADAWSPAVPSLYVLRVELLPPAGEGPGAAPAPDELWSTFGIRHVAVDPIRPQVLLNGEAVFFRGVGLHAEHLEFDAAGELSGGTSVQSPEQVFDELQDARAVGADLLRTGHVPADPVMLNLADRLGFAVWEEIPLYHATPVIFQNTLERGIAQQMLREMALRDMNHPSVLFHGLANESTGAEERTDALAELHEVDRQIDGTRLTGQAAYGWQPQDATHAPLDVAGFTSYQGVFYGEEPGPDTRRALRAAHEAHPTKPIVILEFGRWADLPFDERRQRVIFEETYAALDDYRADEPGGFVSAATWWTLHDFATQLAGIGLEQFGLYRPDGTLRPAGIAASAAFSASAGRGADLMLDPELDRPRAQPEREMGDWTLVWYLAYGVLVATAPIGAATYVLTRRGGRAIGRVG